MATGADIICLLPLVISISLAVRYEPVTEVANVGAVRGAFRSNADCKSVCAERVPVILPQVPPPHPPPKSDTNTFFKLPLSLVSEINT